MHPIATTTPGISKPIPGTNPPGLSAPGSAPGSARLLTCLGPGSWLGSARLDSWLGPAQAPGSARLPAPGYSGLPPHDDIPRYLTAVAVALAIAFQALQAIQAFKFSKLPSFQSSPSYPDFPCSLDSKVYPSFPSLQTIQVPPTSKVCPNFPNSPGYLSLSDFQSLSKPIQLSNLYNFHTLSN